MRIERNMAAHVIEHFLPPDAKLKKSIEIVQFQSRHLNWDGHLRLVQRAEKFKLEKIKIAERSALAEWNAMYVAKIEEYRRLLRASFKYDGLFALI